jgi:hypothetical protein
MNNEIIILDSDYDDETRIIAESRRLNLYPNMKGKLIVLPKATRPYLIAELNLGKIGFISGSGHGNELEFIGSDRSPLFEVDNYNSNEVSEKILHFLACSCAFTLGMDLKNNGCKAFFGYDQIFVFIKEYLDEFLAADHILDISISEGKTASMAHDAYMIEYERVKSDMLKRGISSTVVGFLEENMKSFCSPTKSASWGDKNAKLS